MNRPRLDFLAIKDAAPILKVAELLNLKLKREQKSSRCDCPVKPKHGRALAITPGYRNKDGSLGAFYCESCRENGDAISLYAHVTGCNNYDAAAALADHFKVNAPTRSPAPATEEGLQPLKDLDTTHEALELYGLSQAVCEALGAGYCNKGMMAARIAIPLRLEDGTLIGYLGFATKADQKPLIKIPSNLEERIGVSGTAQEPEVKSQDEMRRLLRVV